MLKYVALLLILSLAHVRAQTVEYSSLAQGGARAGHCAISTVLGGQFPGAAAWGGENNNGVLDTFALYGIGVDLWLLGTNLNTPPAGGRRDASCFFNNNLVYLFGGTNGTDDTNAFFAAAIFVDVSSLLPNVTVTYFPVDQISGENVTLPSARSASTLNFVNNKVYLFGGGTGPSLAPVADQFYVGDLNGTSITWNALPGNFSVAGHTATYSANSQRIIVFGGLLNGGAASNRLFIFDTTRDVWIGDPSPPGKSPAARLFHAAFLTPQEVLYVFGGRSSPTAFNATVPTMTVPEYNISGNSWLPKTATGSVTAPRSQVAYVVNPVNPFQLIVQGGRSGQLGAAPLDATVAMTIDLSPPNSTTTAGTTASVTSTSGATGNSTTGATSAGTTSGSNTTSATSAATSANTTASTAATTGAATSAGTSAAATTGAVGTSAASTGASTEATTAASTTDAPDSGAPVMMKGIMAFVGLLVCVAMY